MIDIEIKWRGAVVRVILHEEVLARKKNGELDAGRAIMRGLREIERHVERESKKKGFFPWGK